jgi:hypothetical protein
MGPLEWLADTGVAQALTAWPTLYIFINAAHILGIGLLAGAILPLDLRLLGLFKRFPLALLGPFLSRAAMTGVILAMLSGLLLFCAKAPDYAANPAFLTKMALLATGLANALLLHAHPGWRLALASGQASARVRIAAAVSMLCWLSAILAGRWIGFL